MKSSLTPPLQSKALLTRNTIINIAGQGIPLTIAIFAVPIIIQRAGTDRFGILSLIWLIIGYFGLFDLGLGRALTQKVSQALAAEKNHEVPGLLHASLHITFGLGIVAATLLFFFAARLVILVLKIPLSLHQETIVAIEIMAFSLPATLSSACLQGYLEAIQRFDLINWVKATLGGFTLLTPLATLAFSHSLIPIVIMLVIGRITAFFVFFLLCRRSLPTLFQTPRPNSRAIASLFKFGGWMTVSNVIGPLMVYLDRFLIGAVISMAAVAYYATPYEVVTKLWIIPFSVVGVLFPAFAMSYGQNNKQYLLRLFDRGQVYLFMGLYPITLIVITFAHEGLTLWLDNEFASNGTVAMQILMLGVFINSLALIPYTLIQAVGRPDLTAKLHILELPLYIVLLLWLLKNYGIEGAAIAWVLRIILDTVVLFSLVRGKILPEAARPIKKNILAISVSCILVYFPARMAQNLGPKLVAVLLVLIFFFYSCWSRLLDTKEKYFMKNLIRETLQKIGLRRLARNIGFSRESKLAHQYCIGKGIEIGGSAHNPFALNTLNIDCSDSRETSFKKDEIRLCGRALPVDIVAAGDYLPLADESQDFVVSSHVLEHFANPINTLLEWDRVIRPMGIIFMIVPHKERTFDKKRERTPLIHLIDDFRRNASGPTDDEHGHHHVWITEDVVELIHHMISAHQMAWELLRAEDRDDKVGNGFTVIIRKLKSRAGTIIATDHHKSCH